MRTTAAAVVVGLTLLLAPEAHAQFANRSLGLGVGYMSLRADNEPITWGVPVTLEAGYYVENGWDLYLRVPLMLLYSQVGLGPTGADAGLVIATGGQFGARYLFMEETMRPWAGAHLAGLYIMREGAIGPTAFGGVGVNAGLDYFVADSISLGARAYFDLYLMLNVPPRFSIGATVVAATYF